jgi:hypothetical protein
MSSKRPNWRDWFTKDGTYLGVVSARTGPDKIETQQPCKCDVCVKGRVVKQTQGES